MLFDTTPGVGVVGAAGFEYCSGADAPAPASSAVTCPTLAASVGAVPAATLVICRVAPGAPTETSPAEPLAAPRVAVDPAPSATLFGAVTLAPLPSATEVVAAGVVVAPLPRAIELISPALAGVPLPRPVI